MCNFNLGLVVFNLMNSYVQIIGGRKNNPPEHEENKAMSMPILIRPAEYANLILRCTNDDKVEAVKRLIEGQKQLKLPTSYMLDTIAKIIE